ncbi:MAG: hypothetical protein ACI9TH_000981 [Kiritimatiellia bacterium]|jgi:hypothetical protein
MKIVLSTLILCFAAAPLFAEKIKEADPTQVDADYALQGEYAGTCGDKKLGVQVIALGGGKFQSVGYIGGLPGDGWDKGDRERTDGELKDGVVVFVGAKGHIGTLKDGKIQVANEGKPVCTLKKVQRVSPTMGLKPPAGAVVLFDGSTAEHFHGGKITEDGLLEQGVKSKQEFGSHTIHLEFRTPYKPTARGQGRGNSGLYMQGRYETQILDSFGLEGENNECGGIYSIRKSDENMCFPPLTWQTYDVDFTAAKFEGDKKTANARMTVTLNGVVIHNDVELPKSTTASPKKEGPEPGFVYIQDHGNPVRMRNIWVVPK